tara:strand:- start:1948 stop:2211 length:264 start_codon:yes stop_codon:yes gene_type:complete
VAAVVVRLRPVKLVKVYVDFIPPEAIVVSPVSLVVPNPPTSKRYGALASVALISKVPICVCSPAVPITPVDVVCDEVRPEKPVLIKE